MATTGPSTFTRASRSGAACTFRGHRATGPPPHVPQGQLHGGEDEREVAPANPAPCKQLVENTSNEVCFIFSLILGILSSLEGHAPTGESRSCGYSSWP